jgi:hypothetical protein
MLLRSGGCLRQGTPQSWTLNLLEENKRHCWKGTRIKSEDTYSNLNPKP